MDATLLTDPAFWTSADHWSAEPLPALPELRGHVFFRTSGSTGTPKWIALSKNALLLSAAAVNRHLGVTDASTWGLALPIHHVGGFGVIARSFEAACALKIFRPRWEPCAFSEWLDHSQVTHTSLVPTQVHDLVKAGLKAPASLRAIVVGGGHLDQATGHAARALGWPVLASYGMTEAGSQIATQSLAALDQPYISAPLPLLPIWHARLTTDGLLEIDGPALFSGVLTDAGYQPRPVGWHVTSDRAVLENEQLIPLGRADFTVKILGELVSVESVELELRELSGGWLTTENFAVVAIPDARSENALIPVFHQSLDVVRIGEILMRYQESAAGFRRLRSPVFIAEIPCTALGKLRRAELTSRIYALSSGMA